jgi:hypothetical protein
LKRKANRSKFKPRRRPLILRSHSAARDREGMDSLRTLSQKDTGTFIKSGTRGQHVVHQKKALAPDSRGRAQTKGIPQVSHAMTTIKMRLGDCITNPLESLTKFPPLRAG